MGNTIILVVLLIIWVCNAPYPTLSQQECHPQDQKVLLQIKQELGNPSLLSSWDPATSDCCANSWQGVICNNFNPYRVNHLGLNGLDLPGPVNFPPSVTNLPYLDQLIIIDMPNLTGTIPPSIVKLTNLMVFYLADTNVSGPTLLSSSLITLTLSHNKLSGKIPASLGKLDVPFLDLSANDLEGDASMLFGAQKSTRGINLSRNKLAFDVGKVEFGKNITNVDLKYNHIYGKLPEGVTKLQFLRRFNVSHNDQCGEIPQGGTGRLQNWFNEYCYAHNKCLCGSPLANCNS